MMAIVHAFALVLLVYLILLLVLCVICICVSISGICNNPGNSYKIKSRIEGRNRISERARSNLAAMNATPVIRNV